MPYPNYHAARVRNPGDFKPGSFKTIELPKSEGGKGGVLMIIGILKGQTTTTAQAYRFPKTLYTVAEAKAWLKENNVKYISFEPAQETQAAKREVLTRIRDVFKPSAGKDPSLEHGTLTEILIDKMIQ